MGGSATIVSSHPTCIATPSVAPEEIPSIGSCRIVSAGAVQPPSGFLASVLLESRISVRYGFCRVVEKMHGKVYDICKLGVANGLSSVMRKTRTAGLPG